MKKQLLAMLCVLMLIVAVFSACNGNKTTSSAAESKPASTVASNVTSSEVKKDEVRDVIFWRYGDTKSNQAVDAVNKALNEYVTPKYNLNVTMIFKDDLIATTQLAVSAKENIDIFWCNGGTLTDTLYKSNGLYDFSSVLKNYDGLYKSIPDYVWESFTYGDGEVYHIPCYKESAVGCDFQIRTDVAEQLKLDLSKYNEKNLMTIDDITSVLESIKGLGIAYPWVPSAYTIQYAREYVLQDKLAAIRPFVGVDLTGDTTKIVNLTETKAFSDYLAQMKSWVDAGYVQTDLLTDGKSYSKDTVAANQVAATVWCRTPDNDANADLRYGAGMDLAPMTGTMMNNTTALGSAYSIPSYEKDIDKSLTWMQALYTDQTIADLVCFGIEGTNYTREGDYVVKKAETGYGADPWSCVNIMCVSLVKGDSADKKQQYADFNASASLSPLCGFHPDLSTIDAEISACTAVVTTYEKTLCAGFTTSDISLEKYQAALKEAGIEKVVTEIQKQYTEWLGKKK